MIFLVILLICLFWISANKDLKDSKNFNSWFNQSFEKHRLEDPLEQGYGDWLKSDEGFQNIDENVTKNNMNEIFEQKKTFWTHRYLSTKASLNLMTQMTL